jgi:cytochrome c553
MKQSLIALVALAGCLSTGIAFAEDGAEPVNAAEVVTTVCAMCHGEDGNKMLTPETPKIGGQKADYLAKSLHDYKSGGRKNPIMAAVAQPLSDEAIEALAEYFAAQKSELHTLK